MKNYTNDIFYKSDISSRIIKCAYNVHNILGSGFQELIYQRALLSEFVEEGLEFKREMTMPIIYKEKEIGSRRVDFLVDGDIMVELKALAMLDNLHYAQLMNYVEVYRVKIGLLLNFGAKKLEIKRFIK